MSGKTRAQKQQQPSVEPGNDSEDGSVSPPNDQLISAASASNTATVSSLPGFSNEQVDSLEQLFTRKFNDFFIRLQTLQQHGQQQQGQIQHSEQSPNSPALPTTEHPDPPRNRRERRDLQFQRGRFSTPDGELNRDEHQHPRDSDDDIEAPLTSLVKIPALKAEDVGFFDP